jgi:uncharacterized protein YjbJ (UPF0337 family)
MTNDILKTQWKQLKSEIQKKWNKITSDDLDKVNGSTEKMQDLLQEKYGLEKEESQKKLHDFVKNHAVAM